MMPLLTPAANGGGAVLSSSHHCSLKSVHPVAPLFSKRRPSFSASRALKPLTLANAAESSSDASAKPFTATSSSSSSAPFDDQGSTPNPISLVGQENVPLEGVIQFEKPDSSSRLAKWGLVALLAGGDVAMLLLFAAIGRSSHGLPVFDFETFKTADPFIAGWFLSAYFLGGFSKEGRGKNGLQSAVCYKHGSVMVRNVLFLLEESRKCFALLRVVDRRKTERRHPGLDLLLSANLSDVRSHHNMLSFTFQLGIIIRALSIGHPPPTNFMLVTMGSTAVLLIGWRALFFIIFPSDKGKKNDVYKRGSPFELFEVGSHGCDPVRSRLYPDSHKRTCSRVRVCVSMASATK
ncbi:hypothetical protein SASPL_137199 [Salvia splendens]|uniref:Uncharacterized protein n=1 Tax=Salvia splendens TaxID=180675 RepID=A0A8X8WT00_SALSN|nr:hypothetical protein SASPL_137199 [Salvia splendens]